jgi:hypothetical protein
MYRNTASQVIGAQLVAKADGTNVTTGTCTVYVTKDAGTQAAGSVGSGAATHEGQGFWTYAPAQAETDAGHVAFTFTHADAVSATVQVYPVVLNDYADAFLNRDMATGTDSGSATVRTVRQALRFLRNKWSISGSTLTVTKENDTTTSWTSELTTSGTAEPVTASDPASA